MYAEATWTGAYYHLSFPNLAHIPIHNRAVYLSKHTSRKYTVGMESYPSPTTLGHGGAHFSQYIQLFSIHPTIYS